MVQRGLLTTHPESNHGDGEASRGQSSLRQGAGTGTYADLDLGIAMAAEHVA